MTRNTRYIILSLLLVIAFGSLWLARDQIQAAFRANTSSDNTPASGLVTHWTFDGPYMLQNVTDSSGTNHHGFIDGQTATTTTIGMVNQAIDLDGSNDRVVVSDNATNSMGDIDFALGFWLKFDSFSNDTGLVGKWNLTGNQREYLVYYNAGTITWFLDSAGDNVTTQTAVSSVTPVVNRWYYVYTWHDSVNNTMGIKIYDSVTGTLTTNQSAFTTGVFDGTGNFRIGSYSNGNFLNGQVDDFRLWKRVLRDDEIKSLYSRSTNKISMNTSSDNTPASGLVTHWTFDGPYMLQNVTDSSGTNHHGFIDGQTATTTTIGMVNQAIDLDGSNDRVVVSDNATNSMGDIDFALGFWLKFDSFSNDTGLVGKWNLTGNQREYLVYYNAGTITWFLDSAGDNVTTQTAVSSVTPVVNRWYYVYTWHDSVNNTMGIKIYDSVTGTLTTNQSAFTTGVFDGTGNFRIGSYSNGNFLNGQVDDFRLWKRVLRDDEIKSLYSRSTNKISMNTGQYSNSSLTSGLIGHWTFDGPDTTSTTATDRGSGGNNGTLTNMTFSQAQRPGIHGQALVFDGSNDYVKIANANAGPLTTIGTGDFTIAYWASITGTNTFRWVIGNWSDTGILLGLHSNDVGTFGGYVGDSSDVRSSFDIPHDGTWHHYVLTRTSGTIAFIVDGQSSSLAQGTATKTGTLSANAETRIGDRPTISSQPWLGGVDDVRIYNRALSATEITQLYNLGKR